MTKPPPEPPPASAPSATCDNCAAPLDGEFCGRCGQSTWSLDLPVGDFAREVAGEALGLDSRLRRTLPALLFRPGRVAAEFVAGRRARYVPPIRLYLFASFAMFLVLSVGTGVQVRGLTEDDGATSAAEGPGAAVAAEPEIDVALGGGELEASLERRISEGFQRIADDREQFSRDFLSRMAQSFFFLLPAFAGLLKVFYRRRLYVHHLVFAIYLHALAFMLVALVATPDALGFPAVTESIALVLLVMPVHLVVGMKRFYGGSWLAAVAKGFTVGVAYNALAGITMIALFILLLTVG